MGTWEPLRPETGRDGAALTCSRWPVELGEDSTEKADIGPKLAEIVVPKRINGLPVMVLQGHGTVASRR